MDFNQYKRLTVSQIPPTNYSVQRKILVEEIFEDLQSKTTLIRKINCQEVYDYQNEKVSIHLLENASKIANGETRDCGVRSATYHTSLPNHGVLTNFENYKSDQRVSCITTNIGEETPMEIDSSSDQLIMNSNNFEKINQDSDTLISNTTKFRKRNNKNRNNKILSLASKGNESYSTLVSINEPLISRYLKVLLIIIVLLLTIVVYIFIAGDYFIYINKNIQLENIKKDLQEYVVHQEGAIKTVIQNFERSDTWRGIKILPFIGSTGVGKTFTANIIKKHFLPQLVNEIDINQFINTKKQNLDKLNNCCCNLIIIDNLRASNFNDFMKFVDSLPKSYVLLVIPIFNIQDTVDGVTHTVQEKDFQFIRNELENSKLHYEFVLFDMLNPRVIDKWLRKELYKRQISENRHDALIKFLLDNNHVKYKGLKGLNSQLLLALDNN